MHYQLQRSHRKTQDKVGLHATSGKGQQEAGRGVFKRALTQFQAAATAEGRKGITGGYVPFGFHSAVVGGD